MPTTLGGSTPKSLPVSARSYHVFCAVKVTARSKVISSLAACNTASTSSLLIIDEADLEGCNIDFGTTGECPVDGTPVCDRGACSWSN